MATFDDVRALAMALPDVTEGARWGNLTWFVHLQGFVWDRPLNKSDLAALGEHAPPAGPILAAYVADLDDKDVLVTEEPDVFVTIPARPPRRRPARGAGHRRLARPGAQAAGRGLSRRPRADLIAAA